VQPPALAGGKTCKYQEYDANFDLLDSLYMMTGRKKVTYNKIFLQYEPSSKTKHKNKIPS
jgi:hypothetical protein